MPGNVSNVTCQAAASNSRAAAERRSRRLVPGRGPDQVPDAAARRASGWVVLAAAGRAMAGAGILLAPGLLMRMRSSQLLAATATAGARSRQQDRKSVGEGKRARRGE